MKLLIFTLLILFTFNIYARSGSLYQNEIIQDNPLIVTHASATYLSHPGLGSALDKYIKGHKGDVIYLMANNEEVVKWYSQENPNYYFITRDGEHKIEFNINKLTFAGGFLSLCLNRSIIAAVNGLFAKNYSQVDITFLSQAIYEDHHFFPIDYSQENWEKIFNWQISNLGATTLAENLIHNPISTMNTLYEHFKTELPMVNIYINNKLQDGLSPDFTLNSLYFWIE